MIKPCMYDVALHIKSKGEASWLKTHIEAYGPVSPFTSPSSSSLKPTLRAGERLALSTSPKPTLRASERNKCKHATPPPIPSKNSVIYKSPSHAFDDDPEEQIVIEESLNLAAELAEAGGNSDNISTSGNSLMEETISS